MIRRYFLPLPRWVGWSFFVSGAFLAGAIFNWAAAEGGGALFLTSLILSGPGLAKIASRCSVGNPTEEQLDRWLEKDLEEISLRAAAAQPCEPGLKGPIWIRGLPLREIDDPQVYYKKGRDALIRFTPVTAVGLRFGPEEVSAWRCQWDLFTGTAGAAEAAIFPKDAFSVSPRLEDGSLRGRKTRHPDLRMELSSGITITAPGRAPWAIPLGHAAIAQALGGGAFAASGAEEVLGQGGERMNERR